MTEAAVIGSEAVTTHDDLTAAKAAEGVTWIDTALDDRAAVDAVADVFGLHPLAIEDVRSGVRPKTEEFADHTFVLIKHATLRRGGDDLRGGARRGADRAVHRTGLVGIGQSQSDPRDPTSLGGGPARGASRARSAADWLAYRVIDGVVDGYFDLLDGIEVIEDAVVETPERDTLAQINAARRELLSVRKLLWPMREAIGVLARGDPDVVAQQTEKYYRDIYDHLVQQVDLVETYRDLVSGSRDIYLNVLSMSTNEVMKRLTVVATIVLPMTVIVGIYGMNFETMPELGWTYGYPAVILGMASMSAILLWYFRREEWL